MDPATVIALTTAALAAFNKGMVALEALKQDKEMTPEQEADYDALVEQRMKQPHWKRSDAPGV